MCGDQAQNTANGFAAHLRAQHRLATPCGGKGGQRGEWRILIVEAGILAVPQPAGGQRRSRSRSHFRGPAVRLAITESSEAISAEASPVSPKTSWERVDAELLKQPATTGHSTIQS